MILVFRVLPQRPSQRATISKNFDFVFVVVSHFERPFLVFQPRQNQLSDPEAREGGNVEGVEGAREP